MNIPGSHEAAEELPAHSQLFDDIEPGEGDVDVGCDPDPDPDAEIEVAFIAAEARPGCASVDDAQLAAWIGGIVEHDERALLALYDATLSRVYGLVLRLVRRASLAEEVAEEVFFQVWRQAPRFNPERGRPLTWLLGMARSRAIDAIRREARFQHDELDEETAVMAGPRAGSGDELLAVAQGHAQLHRALLLLKPQPRQLVALAFFSGLSHEEIATQTHLPLGTVKSQIRRALSTLRDALGDHGMHALPA